MPIPFRTAPIVQKSAPRRHDITDPRIQAKRDRPPCWGVPRRLLAPHIEKLLSHRSARIAELFQSPKPLIPNPYRRLCLYASRCISRYTIQIHSFTTTTAVHPLLLTQPKTARHICTMVREWLWHSKCHNFGHRIRCVAVAVSRWIDVDDLEAQAVVDQLLHRHRPGREHAARDLARAGGGLGE